MTATYTFDAVSTLDRFGSCDEHGDWGGFWGKHDELISHDGRTLELTYRPTLH